MSRAKKVDLDLHLTFKREEGTPGSAIDVDELIAQAIEEIEGLQIWIDPTSGQGDQVCFEIEASPVVTKKEDLSDGAPRPVETLRAAEGELL